MATDLCAARLLVYRGASVLEKTGACHNEASFAKVAGAECYMHCAYTGLHLLGGVLALRREPSHGGCHVFLREGQ
jgi:alkylation response protein AidB-like acyl-CoA dehydrogenase